MQLSIYISVSLIILQFKLSYTTIVKDISSNVTEINTVLVELANLVLDKYFIKNKCIVIISESYEILRNVRSNSSVIHFVTDSENEDCYLVLHDFLRETFKDNCNGYVVQLKKPLCAMAAWEETYKKRFIPRHNPKFFFLPYYPGALTYAEELMSMRITDISENIVAAEIYENQTDWTVVISCNNFYQHPLTAGRKPALYLDEWHHTRGFMEGVDLYPDKVADLRGKDFRISTGKYLPFSIDVPLDGMENRIAKLFCEKHNCTPVALSDEFYWGTIYTNLSGNGALGNVYIDIADIGAFAVYLWLEEYYYIDYSDSYLRGEVTVMTPKPTRLGGWMVPFLPFKVDMWVALFLSLFLSAGSLYFITKASIKYTRFSELLIKKEQFTTVEDSWMRAIGLVVLQQPSSQLIGDSPNRYLFTSFEFLYLVLSAMYSAELASFLTIPLYNPPIDLFHEFAVSDITWYGTHEAWTYALRGSPDSDALAIVDHFQVLPMEQLKHAAKQGKYGFTCERLPGGSITEQDHVTAEIIPMYHIMKDYLFGSPLVVSIKKAGPYNRYYNRIINKVIEHGFSLHWEAEVARKYLDSRIQAEYNNAKIIHIDSSPTDIKVESIQGIVYLYGVGILLAFIFFIYEKIKPPKDTSTNMLHESEHEEHINS